MQAKRTLSSESVSARWTRLLSELRPYLWTIVLYALLLLPLVSLLPAASQIWGKLLLTIALVVAFAVLHWLVMFGHPQWPAQADRMVPFVLAILVLTAALNWLDPNYAFLFLFVVGYAFRYLPLRWAALVDILVLAAVIGERVIPLLYSISPANVLGAVASKAWLLFGILLVTWIAHFARMARERQELLEQLQATQSELAAAERQAGILEERARLAREIHDTLAQGLTSIVMHLEAAEQMLPTHAEAASEHLDQARRSARDNLAETRRFVWALQPQALERDALPQALSRVAQHWTDESHIPVAVSVTGRPCPLLPEAQVTLLRAAQEALANVSKHARASQVTLTLSYMNDRVMMDVNDDGVGFDLAQMGADGAADGFGLAGMRQRVERLEGHLTIESAPGEGTTVVAEIPIVKSVEEN